MSLTVNDIGTLGEYTMSNLKAATGIGDDRLSAHHPNGTGNTTAFGDFAIEVVGHNPGSGDPADYTRLLRPVQVTVDGNTQSISGSYPTGQDPPFFDFSGFELDPRNPDKFTLRLFAETETTGFGIEQILKDPNSNSLGSALSITDIGNAKLIDVTPNTGGLPYYLDLQFEVTGFINLDVGLTYDDPLNTQASLQGSSSTDGEGNSLPENAGLAFRTEDVLDSNPILTDWYWQVENTGAGFDVDFNITSNNSYSEGNVMYDPANRIDAQFKLADTKTNFDNNNFYASDTSPQFDDINHPDQQGVLSSNNAIDFYLQVEDQSGTLADAVTLRLDENNGITLPASGNTKCYRIQGPEDRTQGTRSNLYVMDDVSTITC